MEKLSDRLEDITGWRVVPVTELVPDDVFFNHLANRRFPAGAFIRPGNRTSSTTFSATSRC
jgi:phenylalanine-4-hydroxylase